MSPTEKNPAQLLGTARRLTPPLDRSDIRNLVRQFPTGGPAPPDPTPLPTVLTVAGLVATVGLLLMTLPDWLGASEVVAALPERTHAPIQKAPPQPTAPPEAEPQPSDISSTSIHPAAGITSEASFAPRSGHESSSEVYTNRDRAPKPSEVYTDRNRSSAPLQNPSKAHTESSSRTKLPKAEEVTRTSPFAPISVTGTWEWADPTHPALHLHPAAANEPLSTAPSLRTAVTPEELGAAFLKNNPNGILERETGRLLLAETGEFAFQARPTVRERYVKKGWVTPSDKPQKWFRYFTHQVGEEYFELLGALSLDRKELPKLSELVEQGVSLTQLHKLGRHLSTLGYEPNRTSVQQLLDFHHHAPLLTALTHYDYRLDDETWGDIQAAGLSSFYLENVNSGRTEPYTLREVLDIHAAGVADHAAGAYTAAFDRDLPAADLIELHRAGVSPAAAREMLSNRYTGGTVRQIIRNYRPPLMEVELDDGYLGFNGPAWDQLPQRSSADTTVIHLESFDKLIVMDGFHVNVVAGDSNRVIIEARPDDFEHVKIEVNRRGNLEIYSVVPIVGKYIDKGKTGITVVAKDLKKVHARGHSKVTVDPAVGVEKWSTYYKAEVHIRPVEEAGPKH